MDGRIAIEEHFVTPELEDVVLDPGWAEDAFRRTTASGTPMVMDACPAIEWRHRAA